jgi:hypothetical protein
LPSPDSNASAEKLFVIASRPLYVRNGEKMRDADSLSRRDLIALLINLNNPRSRSAASYTPAIRDQPRLIRCAILGWPVI